MKSTPKAKAVHARKKDENSLTQGVVVPFRNAAEKFAKWRKPDPEITDKVRLSRARMAAEALPVSGGDRTAHQEPGEPTPQRRVKNFRPPLQPYSGKWPPDVEFAFARFLFESELLEQHEQRTTISYEGGGGGSDPSRRSGGLPDRVREIGRCYKFVRHHLDVDSTYVLDMLVLCRRYESTGEVATLEQIGGWLFPWIRDVATRKGGSLGALRVIGKQLDILYAEYERDHRGR